MKEFCKKEIEFQFIKLDHNCNKMIEVMKECHQEVEVTDMTGELETVIHDVVHHGRSLPVVCRSLPVDDGSLPRIVDEKMMSMDMGVGLAGVAEVYVENRLDRCEGEEN